jgi:hypothetical protein
MNEEKSMFEVDLDDLDLDELINRTDSFTLMILRNLYDEETILKLDEDGKARFVAFRVAHRYLEAMKALAERYAQLESDRAALSKLV